MTSTRRRTAAAPARGARVCSFAPVEDRAARVLILGSMPGAASLAAQQYYAHPRNRFWSIMGALYGAHATLPYRQRLERLQAHGIALWDVFASCARPGSLDAAIDQRTAVINDIPALLQRCRYIDRVCCNGTTAYNAFQRHLGHSIARSEPVLQILRLPSTSPANASWSAARKLEAWRRALSRGRAVVERASSSVNRI
jgi:TDG/mug DNA glycosylase family protein